MSADFDDYVRARSAGLIRLAYLLVGDAHEAEDLVQSVLARLAARWSHVQRMDNVDAYARTAVTNAASSWWRRRRRRHDVPTAVIPDVGVADPEYSQRDALIGLLRQLPPRQRSVIVLRYYEDLSEAETASVLGCSVGTVKSQSVKARRTLREAWQALDPTPTLPGGTA